MATESTNRYKQVSISPYNKFLYALRAPETKRQYPRRLEVFQNYIEIEGSSAEEKLSKLFNHARSNTEWLQDALINFITITNKNFQMVFAIIAHSNQVLKI